jgi:hypothetical protein
MDAPTRPTTLDRNGVTTIETKRWLMGTLYDGEDELESAPSVESRRVASD